ncbi:glycosyltransferase family 2 protein [Helicobacter equorum]|uniref:glycosyltransferase family 2 protein n=3 Tax=Helicobacter equorum TaxID=361872 RepID=UPI00361EE957
MTQPKLPISVTILVKNAQTTLKKCLDSLQSFDEIILLDNDSSDTTLQIAQDFQASYQNLKIYTSEFIGFGALKNLAVSHTSNAWIFSIDSDEVLESNTLALLTQLFSKDNLPTPNTLFALPRKNLYNGKWIKACGWYPDFVTRIFHKEYTCFNNNVVHESIIVPKDARFIKLDSGLTHYAFRDITHLLEKLQRYSSLWAEQHTHKIASPLKAIIRGGWSFVKNYVLQKGFLYGYRGFIISVCNALGVFFKYMKLYENQITPPHSVSLIITTYNQKERLALALDSIKHLHTLPTEVLVADDGSKEDTKELIESYMKNFPCTLRHIWQEDDGFRVSKIRNKAINAAICEYIVIIDGDMILESNFISDHLKYAKLGSLLQGSRVVLTSNKTQEILDSMDYKIAFKSSDFKARRIDLFAKSIYIASKLTKKVFNKKEMIKGVRSCNMSFYKRDCEAINGFNQDFIGWGREDSEFVARFLFNGGVLRRLKFAGIAYHLYHEENARDMLESNHQIYLATIRTKAKHCQNGLKDPQ